MNGMHHTMQYERRKEQGKREEETKRKERKKDY